VRALFACLGVVALVAAGCGHTHSRRLESAGISVDLPRGWHGRISKSERPVRGAAVLVAANGRLRARVVLSETLAGYDAPVEPARIAPDERRASVDRYVRKSGRAFWLHATLGSKRSIGAVNAILGSLSVEPRAHPLKPAPDPAPARALRPPLLLSTPAGVVAQCRRAQARSPTTLLCPRRLPRPSVRWRNATLPRLNAYMLPAPGATWTSHSDPRYRHRRAGGVTIGYGGPWEPDSGPDWHGHLWRNRPCCFLHFEVFWRRAGRRQVPAGARPAVLGGRRGLLKDASSYGLASATGDYMYFPNHTRFLWRENGVDYVASLHRFGSLQETRALLNRLIRELRPVGEL
jgi:hypothetical protein